MEAIETTGSPSTTDRPGLDRADLWAVVGLLALGVILPVLVGLVSGALDMPRNDDWTFRHIALGLYQTGRVQLNGFEAMTLVGPPDWWVQLFPSFRTCGVVSSAPLALAGARLISTEPVSYRLLLFTGLDQPLYLYRVDGPGCPSG